MMLDKVFKYRLLAGMIQAIQTEIAEGLELLCLQQIPIGCMLILLASLKPMMQDILEFIEAMMVEQLGHCQTVQMEGLILQRILIWR